MTQMISRRIWLLALMACAIAAAVFACTPDMIQHKDETKTEASTEDPIADAAVTDDVKVDQGGGTSCKHDCDCLASGNVCDEANGKCAALRRVSNCVACDANCKPGDPCADKDNKVGTCGTATPCKDDCDCFAKGGVCHQNSCDNTIKRASQCPSCLSTTCAPGTRCHNPDQSIGTCGTTKACKHDCDCEGTGLLCDAGKCIPLQRVGNCLACDDKCKPGEPCLKADKSIGTCSTPKSCKHDCDCHADGMVCQGNVCSSIERASACLACDGKCNAGQPCANADGSIGTCGATAKSCKHDCDCFADQQACESGKCSDVNRPNICLPCTGQCTAGSPCHHADKSAGVCGTPKSCVNDCDCSGGEGVCHEGKCNATLKRAYICPSCDGTCDNGKPCENKDGSLGICGSKSCKHDCDCISNGYSCDGTVCRPLRRLSFCLVCTDANCKAGDPCQNPDKSISTCGGVVKCSDDCDCAASGGVCEGGSCNKIVTRVSNCMACGSANCKVGDRCLNTDGSVGTCTQSCKHDCDCVSIGLLCDAGTCRPLRRISFCLACTDANCKAGDPCQNADKSIGTCSSTPKTYACGTTTCKAGLEYCTTTVGGAPPGCGALPPQPGTTCPTGCNDAGLNCPDGKLRCYCPSSSCAPYKQNCTDCACLQTTGQVPTGACQCQDKGGDAHVTCFAP